MGSKSANSKIRELGEKLAKTFPRANSIRIFCRPTTTASLKEVWNHCPPDSVFGWDGERVIGTCEKTKQSTLIRTASREPLLKEVEGRNFESCLCVPIFDDCRALIALIFLSSDKVEGFNTNGKLKVEKMANRAAPHLTPKQESVIPLSGQATQNGNPQLILIAVAAAVLLVGVLTLSALKPKESPPINTGSRIQSSPKETTRQFAQHLRVGEFSQAWEFLTPTLQSDWPRKTFQRELQYWSESEENQQVLLARKLQGVKVQGIGALATFLPTSGENEGGSWSWELRLIEDEWRIKGLRGGPVKSPTVKK